MAENSVIEPGGAGAGRWAGECGAGGEVGGRLRDLVRTFSSLSIFNLAALGSEGCGTARRVVSVPLQLEGLHLASCSFDSFHVLHSAFMLEWSGLAMVRPGIPSRAATVAGLRVFARLSAFLDHGAYLPTHHQCAPSGLWPGLPTYPPVSQGGATNCDLCA